MSVSKVWMRVFGIVDQRCRFFIFHSKHVVEVCNTVFFEGISSGKIRNNLLIKCSWR